MKMQNRTPLILNHRLIEELNWSNIDCSKARAFNQKYNFTKTMNILLKYDIVPRNGKGINLELSTNINKFYKVLGVGKGSWFPLFHIKLHKQKDKHLIYKVEDFLFKVIGGYGTRETLKYQYFVLDKLNLELCDFLVKELGFKEDSDINIFDFDF